MEHAPPPTKRSLDLLRFMALSTSVHADALQSSVDSTQSALLQMRSEDETFNYLDKQLSTLLVEQQRIHAMYGVLCRSKEERLETEVLLNSQESKRREEANSTLGTGSKRIQSSRTRESDATYEEEKLKRGMLIHDNTTEERLSAVTQKLHAIDHQVEHLRGHIAEKNTMALRTKLLDLERLKQKVKDIDGETLMRELVANFSYPHEVECLWDATGSGENIEQHCNSNASLSTSASPSTTASRTRREQPRSYATVGPTQTNVLHEEQTAVVDHTNVDLLIARALQRFTGRYKEAMARLTGVAIEGESSPKQAFSSLLYAEYLDSPQGNPDAEAVKTLQGLGNTSLADFYKEKYANAVVDRRIAVACLTGRKASLLSDYEFCALPTNWATTGELTSVSNDGLLPPARHILCRRFTFSSTEELKQLDDLRVSVQRQIVDELMDAKSLQEALRGEQEERGVTSEKLEQDVNVARVAVASASSLRRPFAWPTIVSVAEDDK